jgi:hypothetical protein
VSDKLHRWWRAWVELCDRREPPAALALVRIGAALVLLVDHLWVWHVGLVEPLWAPLPRGFAIEGAGFAAPLGLDGFALWGIAVGALALIAVGAATWVACVVFVLASAQQASVAPDGESGIDMLMRLVFAVLALSRCNARWSVDAWIAARIGRPMPSEVPAWPRYLLLLQLVWVYFAAGINKSGEWGPHGGFTALGNALLDPHNGRLDPELIAVVYPLTRVATALTITFELTAPVFLLCTYYAVTPDRTGRVRAWCNRWRVRWIWIALGVFFELGIAIGLKLGAFPFGMLALFWVLLLPRELQRLNTAPPAKRASSPS